MVFPDFSIFFHIFSRCSAPEVPKNTESGPGRPTSRQEMIFCTGLRAQARVLKPKKVIAKHYCAEPKELPTKELPCTTCTTSRREPRRLFRAEAGRESGGATSRLGPPRPVRRAARCAPPLGVSTRRVCALCLCVLSAARARLGSPVVRAQPRLAYEAAHAQGYRIAVWTVNDARLYEQLQRWPVDLIISDYPAGPP